jgi:hypothetical protein
VKRIAAAWAELTRPLGYDRYVAHGGDTGAMVQATRPQLIAYGLTDSPVFQLAWIADGFKKWTGASDVPEDAVDRNAMLTNVMLYWPTGTAGWPNATTASCAGPGSTVAATSSPWKEPTCWSLTCARPSGTTASNRPASASSPRSCSSAPHRAARRVDCLPY